MARRGFEERSAITANVLVVPVFGKVQTSQVSFHVLALFAEDLGAGEPRTAGSVLIDCHRSKAQGDKGRCGGLQIALPVLHSIDSSDSTVATALESAQLPTEKFAIQGSAHQLVEGLC